MTFNGLRHDDDPGIPPMHPERLAAGRHTARRADQPVDPHARHRRVGCRRGVGRRRGRAALDAAVRTGNVRKLVTLPPHLVESIERFRMTGASPKCPTCGRPHEAGKPPSESDAIRELIEDGLRAWDARR
jgi:hypothetical protein